MHQEIAQDNTAMFSVRAMLIAAGLRDAHEKNLYRELNELLDRIAVSYRVLGHLSLAAFSTFDGKTIDDRECEPFDSADTDWGVQDDLANVPRRSPRCA